MRNRTKVRASDRRRGLSHFLPWMLIAVALLGAAIVMLLPDDRPPDDLPPLTGPPPPDRAIPAIDREPSLAQSLLTAVPTDEKRGTRFTGAVVDEGGNPLPEAQVEVFRAVSSGELSRIGPEPLGKSVSNRDGRFDVSSQTTPRHVLIRGQAPGRAGVTGPMIVDAPGVLDVGELRLVPSIEVTGRVVDLTGSPIEGCRVFCGHRASRMVPTAETGENGVFRGTCTPEDELRFAFVKSEYELAVVVGGEADGAIDLGEIQLTPARTLTVRVSKGPRPWPFKLELVVVSSQSPWMVIAEPTQVGETKDFILPWPGLSEVLLLGPGRLELDRISGVEPTGSVVELTCPPFEWLDGMIVDGATQKPLEFTSIGFWSPLLAAQEQLEGGGFVGARTDLFAQDGPVGSFSIPNPGLRRSALLVRIPEVGTVRTDELDLTASPLIVTIRGGSTLLVRLLDMEPGATYRAELWNASGPKASLLSRVPASEDGTATFSRLAEGKYQVTVLPSGSQAPIAWSEYFEVRGPHTEIDLSLVRPGTLRGRVLDADGKPVEDCPVFLQTLNGRIAPQVPSLRTRTNERGEFVFDEVRPGMIGVAAAGTRRQYAEVPPGGEAKLEFRKKGGEAKVAGRITLSGCQGLELHVWASTPGNKHRAIFGEQAIAEDGSYEIDVPPFLIDEECLWIVGTPEGEAIAVKAGTPVSGQLLAIDFSLTLSEVRGRIVDSEGGPIARSMVAADLTADPGYVNRRVWSVSGSDGRFRLVGLAVGMASIQIRAPTGRSDLLYDPASPVAKSIERRVEGEPLDLGDIVID